MSLDFIRESLHTISVKIITDEISEAPEKFHGRISAVNSLPNIVRLEPLRAEVTIIDKEGSEINHVTVINETMQYLCI